MKKDYDSTKIYRKTQKKGASQTYDTPSCLSDRLQLLIEDGNDRWVENEVGDL